jgi:hypothetical protein
MFDKIKDFRNQMKMLKDLQSKMNGVDMTDPKAMLDSMGIDMNDIENHFNESIESDYYCKTKLSTQDRHYLNGFSQTDIQMKDVQFTLT